MKRVLSTILWTIAGYVIGAVVIGLLSGIVFSLMIQAGMRVQDHSSLIRTISMSGVFLSTVTFLLLALAHRLPGTRRALPPA